MNRADFNRIWHKLIDYVDHKLERIHRRRRVVGSSQPGYADIEILDKDGEVASTRSIPMIWPGHGSPGDYIVTATVNDREVGLGVIAKHGEVPIGPGGITLAAFYDPTYPGEESNPPYVMTDVRSIYAWNGIKAIAGSASGRLLLEADWAGSGGTHGTSSKPARSDHTHPASAIVSGVLATARLGSGTANSTVFLRGDGTWAAVPGGLTQENVEDIVGAMAHAGTGIAVTYSDLTSGLLIEVQNVPIDRVTGLQTALDAKAALSHNHPASAITSGVLHTSRLGTGTANSTVFLRGDGTWAAVPAGITEEQITDKHGFVDQVLLSISSESIDYGIAPIFGADVRIMQVNTEWLHGQLDDRILAGTGIDKTYNDVAGTVTLALAAHTHPVTDISATGRTASNYLRGDGTWATPPNTTYTVMSQAEAEAGTATTARTMSAARLKATILYYAAGGSHTHAIADITNLQDELDALETAIDDLTAGGSPHSHANLSILNATTASFTTALETLISEHESEISTMQTQGVYKFHTTIEAAFIILNTSLTGAADNKLASSLAIKTYVDNGLAGKANSGHSHAWGDITGKPTTFTPSTHSHAWAEITGKPSTFAPSAHSHAAGDITSGVIATARLGTGTANSSVFLRGDGTWAAIPGGLTEEDVEDIVGAMAHAGTGIAITYSDLTSGLLIEAQNVPIDRVTGLQAALDGKAASSHTHTIAQVTNLQTELDALETAIDDLTAGGSPHSHSNLSILNAITAAFTTALETKLNGIAAGATANATDAQLRDRATHTGSQAISTVTGLQTALDGKAPVSHNHPASAITSGVLATARLGTGTANSTVFLRGDGTWAAVPGGLTQENVEDIVGAMAVEGTGVDLTYDDTAGTLTIAVPNDHTHANKAVLDATTASFTTAIDSLINTHEAEINAIQTHGVYKINTTIEAAFIITDAGLAGAANDKLASALAVKSYVDSGLSGKAALSHNHPASAITSGVLATARLGTGTANSSVFLRGDGTWAAIPGGLTEEEVEDIVNGLIVGGTGVTTTYNDAANTLTIAVPNDHTHSNKAVLDQVTEPWTTGKQSTLNLFYDLAVLKNTGSVAGWSWVIDEDSMTSNLDTKLPTQQSVKAYVDSGLAGKSNTGHTHAAGDVTSGTFADARIPNLAASKITSGTFATARLGTGTANSSVFLRGDGTWAAVPAGLDTEGVQDIVGAMLAGGTGITVTYNDATGTLTISRNALAIADIGGLQEALDDKVDEDLPFTIFRSVVQAHVDTTSGNPHGTTPAMIGAAEETHTHPVTDISATGRTASNYLRGDGTWATPPNTTYSVMSQAEAEAGTATSARTMSAARLKATILYYALDLATWSTYLSAHSGVHTDIEDRLDALEGAPGSPHGHDNLAILDATTASFTTALETMINEHESEIGTIQSQAVYAFWTTIEAAWIITNTALTGAANNKIASSLAMKTYVDNGLAGKSDSGHTHAWSAITGKPSTFAPSAHTHAAGDITSGVLATARLGTGTANSSVFLRGDGTWAAVPGGLDTEGVQDIVGALLSGGTGVTVTYNDASNTLTIAAHDHSNKAVLDATTASFTTALESLLNTHETEISAIQSQGIFQIHTTITAGFIITDTSLAGAANNKLASALATKTYIDNEIAGRAAASHTHPVTDISATGRTSSNYLRGDGTWATPPNTTYSVMSQAESEAGTATTARTMSAARLKAAILYHAAANGHTHAWGDITGKPSTFTPSSHSHAIADVTDLQDALDGKVDNNLAFTIFRAAVQAHVDTTSGNPHGITPAMIGAALASHTHLWADITDKPSTFTPSSHSHAAGDITSGTLADARIPSLNASKITAGTFADARIPSLAISKTTGLQAALDDKVPIGWSTSIRLETLVSTTSSSNQTISALNVPCGANEKWEVTVIAQIGGGAAGMRIGVYAPSGTWMTQTKRGSSGAASVETGWIDEADFGSGVGFRNYAANAIVSGSIPSGAIHITSIIHTAGTAGNIGVQYRSTTSGQTSMVGTGTYISARRIA